MERVPAARIYIIRRDEMIEKINLTMLTDFYEITMANGYFEADMKGDIAYFDMFFRRIPDDGGYAIMAGLEQVIEYLENLEFGLMFPIDLTNQIHIHKKNWLIY